jgi:CRISPR/Cas system type I-B associated protein Csh2 (Cas7 group RAMP superfamily)
MSDLNGLSVEEKEIVEKFRSLTDRAKELRTETLANALERRDCARALRAKKWSLRKIGQTIGVSGQRIDSMVKMNENAIG